MDRTSLGVDHERVDFRLGNIYRTCPHKLEDEYGLTADELLDALDKRFRAKVTLEGAVAEVQMEKQIRALQVAGIVSRYVEHDLDGYPDFTIWLPNRAEPILAECKNVRNKTEAYRSKGIVTAYQVETQKTRTSNADASTRFYGVDQFHFIGVCLGKKTRNWAQFMFVRVEHLAVHTKHPGKLAPMQMVPLPDSTNIAPWMHTLSDLLATFQEEGD
jgi:hypothetical protein